MSFEEILNEINDKPKAILAPNLNESITDEESKEAQAEQVEEFANIYQRLRSSFRTTEESMQHGSMLEFHLTRLKAEFEESHSAAKL